MSEPEIDRPLAMIDLWRLIKRQRKLICGAALFCGALAVLFALNRPVLFQAEATFRDRGSRAMAMGPSSGVLSAVLSNMGGGSSDQELISLLKSRQLMGPVIQEMGLQASVKEKSIFAGFQGVVWDNMRAELAHLRKSRTPFTTLKPPAIALEELVYLGEVPTAIQIVFIDDQNYRVEQGGVPVGLGRINETLRLENISFKVKENQPGEFLQKRSFDVSIRPLATVAAELAKSLKVKPAEEREKVLRFTFLYPDRHQASRFLNGLMASYYSYMTEESRRFAEIQLSYLRARQQASIDDLQTFMKDHALQLSEDLHSSGIFDTERELQYLLATRLQCCNEAKNVELELRRLLAVDPNDPGDFRALSTSANLPAAVQEALQQLSQWRVKRDTLEVVLQAAAGGQRENGHAIVDAHLADLKAVRCRADQARECLKAIQSGQDLPTVGTDHVAYTWLNLWHSLDPADLMERQTFKESLIAYLHHQLHASKVHERIILERASHQQNPDPELQGIDLNTVEQLFLSLTDEQSKVESSRKQNSFVLEQLQDPHFEISSLAGSLTDPVSRELVAEAGKALIRLQDIGNRSDREQTRLREDLERQRAFLVAHLTQANQLLDLRAEFLQEKNRGLQKVLLDLIQQQVSVSEKHLSDYLLARVDHLQNEKILIDQTLGELRQQMALLPSRWASEQIVNQRLKLNKTMVEEVAKLVESKNISNNLETIQSGPVDRSLPPLLPRQPGILLFAVLGTCLGAVLASGLVVFGGIRKGLAASPENLWLAKQQVAGCLHPQNPQPIETLRRLTAQLPLNEQKVILLVLGDGPDYSREFATLLAQTGAKVLRVCVAFDGNTSPQVVSKGDYDEVIAEGMAQYRSELVTGTRFQALLETYRELYDIILVVTPTKPDTAEAEALVTHFNRVAVTLHEERRQDIDFLIGCTTARISFLFV